LSGTFSGMIYTSSVKVCCLVGGNYLSFEYCLAAQLHQQPRVLQVTAQPTVRPTETPSDGPTAKPTNQPTSIPTSDPTDDVPVVNR
jgi:hypothetical protein